MERHLKDSVPTIKESLNVPPGLESMIRLALAKQPEARFPDARAMLTRLGELDECVAPIDAYAMPTLRISGPDGSALAALHNIMRVMHGCDANTGSPLGRHKPTGCISLHELQKIPQLSKARRYKRDRPR